ncbi:APC family permease [Anoxynatronum sibiricum]|uniref:APC family permease n=1 Tax=Anoxynatronum sibiricum TaxID=210623 RepID=A0ABU9VTV8_9CLOT
MKKMTFSMSFLMAIGSIVGAGIFARTPVVIRLVGDGLVWGFLLAAIFVFFKTVPEVVLSSALPANGASYMHLTRLLHPGFGTVYAFNQLVLGTMNVAVMSLVFAEYSVVLFPEISVKLIGVSIALIFTVISTFGIRVSGWVQNICVTILMIALGVYIFSGLPNGNITLEAVLKPAVSVTRLWAAMGILHGSLIGANVLMFVADEIERPERNIPIIFVLSTISCSILFAIVGFVAIGNIPLDQWADRSVNLATVASQFLSPTMLTFFIVAGPLLAVSTSINAMILMFSRSHFAAARDGLFPLAISKINRFGAPGISIWMNSIVGIGAILVGFDLNDVVLMVSIPGLLIAPIVHLSVFWLPKKFPLSYKNSFLQIPHRVTQIVVVMAIILSYLLGVSVVSKMQPKNWIAMILFYLVAFIYTLARLKYMKEKHNVDIFENMRKPYEPWMIKEKELGRNQEKEMA